jgi:hypothetical protein
MRTGECSRRAWRAQLIALTAVLIEIGGLWLRTRRIGGNLIVRCRDDHLFTTLWIPGASLKSLKLGWWRFQHCPVGDHWSIVTPVDPDILSVQQRREAAARHDLPIP